MTITTRPPGAPGDGGDVLVAAGDVEVAERIAQILRDRGLSVRSVGDDARAIDEVVRGRFIALVIHQEGADSRGRDLVDVVRAYDSEVPIVVVCDDVRPFIGAGVIHVGNPVDPHALVRALDRARHSRRETRPLRREIGSDPPTPRAEVEAVERGQRAHEDLVALYERAVDGLYVAFQPIVAPGSREAFGYEALMRSREPGLSSPPEILTAAERLGRIEQLGRRVRTLSAFAFSGAPEGALLFVNVHSTELLDASLYDSTAPLSALGDRVVLEFTERATMESIGDVPARLSVLRFLGFRLAIDDLGAGYGGISSFATLEPEFVKLDMSLVRNLHMSPGRQRLVSSMVEACRDLGTCVVAEGVEGKEELHTLRDMGCDLFQGYLFARPSQGFERPTWVGLG